MYTKFFFNSSAFFLVSEDFLRKMVYTYINKYILKQIIIKIKLNIIYAFNIITYDPAKIKYYLGIAISILFKKLQDWNVNEKVSFN